MDRLSRTNSLTSWLTAWLTNWLTAQLKSAPTPPVFNDFDFPTALAPQRGANFADLTFQKCSHHAIFQRVWLPNGSLATAWCKFCGAPLKGVPTPPQSLTILLPNRFRATAWCEFCRPDLPKVLPSCHLSTSLTSKRPSRHSLVQILRPATSKRRPTMPVFGAFGFQTALSPQRGDIFSSRSFAPARLWELPLQANGSHTTMDKRGISRNSYPPKRPRLTRLCCIVFARSHFLLKDLRRQRSV